MKLMKHITIALVLCAIPAMAAGQDVTCDECTHQVSVYMGEGGFIANAAEGAEMVTWVASCNGVTRSGELTPNDDGVVSTLLAGELACHSEGGSFELGPIMDGGWYWLTMAENSAVGGLVAKNILMNDNVAMPTDAGDSVTVTPGAGAVLLQHTSGHLGILPTILPVMDMEPDMTPPCGVVRNVAGGTDSEAAGYARLTSNCMMGDGGTITLATTKNGFTGAVEQVKDGGMVYRPRGDTPTSVVVDLWGNHSGFFTTAAAGAAWLGQPEFAMTPLREAARLTGVTISATQKPVNARVGTDLGSTADGGITLTAGTNAATIEIGASEAHCPTDGSYSDSVVVNVTATLSDTTIVTPSVSADPHGSLSFTVMCLSASANMGQELVPENPFPTE